MTFDIFFKSYETVKKKKNNDDVDKFKSLLFQTTGN